MFNISDYDEITIYITDGWREWYVPKFRLTWTVDEPFITLYWTDSEKGTSGVRRELPLDYQDVMFGYTSPSSAAEIASILENYIISAFGGTPGDVFGPASSVNNNIAVFDGITGKLIKDGGYTIADLLSSIGYTVINVSTTPYTVIPVTGQTIYNVDTSGGAITMNFPTAIGNTAAYTVHNRGSNSVIIDPFGAQTINGNTTQTLLFQNTSVDIYSDGANLFIR